MEGKLIKKDDHYFLEVEPYTLNTLQRNALIANTFDKPKGDILQLSLTNCQAIERGYDLDKLAKQYGIDTTGSAYVFTERMDGFKAGFQKALEILGDKKFTEQDMYKMFIYGRSIDTAKKHIKKLEDKPMDEFFNDFIQSLQQTEWDVTFDPEEKDVEGRLILKRK